ncbi:MAG TPA: hypothetical protein VGH19_02545 [Verrucomicrobiae bacterium]
MTGISPGEFTSVAGTAGPQTLIEYNFGVATRMLYKHEPSYVSEEPTDLAGPPDEEGDYVLNQRWRDLYGAEYVCTVESDPETETPYTWKQIRPAVVSAVPTETVPVGYWIVRTDLDYKHYRYTGSGFTEIFLSLTGGTMTGTLVLNGSPTDANHAATKAYVDALAGGGADPKDSCRVATTANVDLATGGPLTIDGVALVSGNRVLVKNQTAPEENGIYVVQSGAWIRASDADADPKVTAGMYCFVIEGTANGDMGYVLTTNDPITLGTTGLTFAQFSKGLSDGECTDVKIGNRTADQSLISPADTGSLTELLSWFAGRIKGITGKSDWKTAPQVDLEKASVVSLNFVIDGGGSVITTGLKGFLEVSFPMTITGVTVLADQTGSAVIDIWKDVYASYPPTGADSITASAKPTISSAVKTKDTTLTGWTTAVNAGDILAFNVDSIATIQRLTISITGKKN